MKLLILAASGIILLGISCGTNSNPGSRSQETTAVKTRVDTVVVFVGIASKGIGRFHHIALQNPLDQKMVAKGKAIYLSKCFACHKLTNELLVGPGWSGVTERRTPEWIMNWITNTKVMLDKDLAAQADLAMCLIRMPNQDLTDEQARDVVEFMRKNDGQQ
jgi:mono/diheme cytochrome c family protein